MSSRGYMRHVGRKIGQLALALLLFLPLILVSIFVPAPVGQDDLSTIVGTAIMVDTRMVRTDGRSYRLGELQLRSSAGRIQAIKAGRTVASYLDDVALGDEVKAEVFITDDGAELYSLAVNGEEVLSYADAFKKKVRLKRFVNIAAWIVAIIGGVNCYYLITDAIKGDEGENSGLG